jgi:hypothetical protein
LRTGSGGADARLVASLGGSNASNFPSRVLTRGIKRRRLILALDNQSLGIIYRL